MDVLKSLHMQFDLDPINSLYDMIREVSYHRPPSGWDIDDLKNKIDFDFKTHRLRKDKLIKMGLQLKAHKEKKFFEKEPKSTSDKMEIDMFRENAHPELPIWVLPLLKPGDTLKGNVSLETTAPMELVNISIECFGHAKTKIISGSGKHRSVLVDKQVFIEKKLIVWPDIFEEDSSNSNTSCFSCSSPQRKTLLPGKYLFPFMFTIPQDARPSLPALNPRREDIVQLSYFLKASLNRGKCLKRGNIIKHHALWVDRKLDVARYQGPVTKEVTQSTGVLGTSGDITVSAHLLKKGYVRGETIPLTLEVNNGTSQIISEVLAYVILSGVYKTRSKCLPKSKKFVISGYAVTSEAISPGMCPQISLDVPFEFPLFDKNLFPGGTLVDCEIIDMSYAMHVVVRRPGITLNKELDIPIFVGTFNSQESQMCIE